MRGAWLIQVIIGLCSCLGFARRGRSLDSRKADDSHSTHVESNRVAGIVNPLEAVASFFFASNPGVRWQHRSGSSRWLSSRSPRYVRAPVVAKAQDEHKDPFGSAQTKFQTMLNSLTKIDLHGDEKAKIDSDALHANFAAHDAAVDHLKSITGGALKHFAEHAAKLDLPPLSELSSLEGKLGEKEKDVERLHQEMKLFKAQLDKSSSDSTGSKVLADDSQEKIADLASELEISKSKLQAQEAKAAAVIAQLRQDMQGYAEKTRTLQSERDALADSHSELEAKLSSTLEEKPSHSESTSEQDIQFVDEMQEKLAMLASELATSKSALEAQEAKADAESAAMKKDMQKLSEEARALRSERDSLRATRKDALVKLAESNLENISSLEAALKDAESKAAVEAYGRATAEKATSALEADLEKTSCDLKASKLVLSELREKNELLLTELQTSNAALEAQDTKSATEAQIAVLDMVERDVHEEVEKKLAAESRAKASLEATVAQQNQDLSSLKASLKEAELQVVNEAKQRAEAEVAIAAIETELDQQKQNVKEDSALVNDLQEKVAALLLDLEQSKAALEAQKAKAADEVAVMMADVEKYTAEASVLRSERDSFAAARKDAETKLAAMNISEYKASLEDAESKAAHEAMSRAAAEKETTALKTDLAQASHDLRDSNELVNKLQEEMKIMHSDLEKSRAALEAQEAQAAAEATAMKTEAEKYATEVRALRSERDSLDAAHKEAVAKYAARNDSSLEDEEANDLRQKMVVFAALEKKSKAAAAAATTALKAEQNRSSVQAKALQAKVNALRSDLETTRGALRSQEAKVTAETTAMKSDMEKHNVQVRSLKSERDAHAAAHRKLEAELASALKEKTALLANMAQKDRDAKSLGSSLHAQSTHDPPVHEMQAEIATLVSELEASKYALEQQEAKAAAEAAALRKDVEYYANAAQELHAERQSLAASHSQSQATFASTDVDSLEASLKVAQLKIENEAEGRIAAEARLSEEMAEIKVLQAEIAAMSNSLAREKAATKREQDRRIRAEWQRR